MANILPCMLYAYAYSIHCMLYAYAYNIQEKILANERAMYAEMTKPHFG